MISKSLSQLITGVRAAVYRRAPNAQVVDTEITDWLNEGIREFWMELAPVMRDDMTALSANLTAVSTLDLNALLTDPAYLAFRGIDRSVDGTGSAASWCKLRPWRFPARGHVGTLSYRVIGEVVRLEPEQLAPGVYRVWYLPAPTVLSAGGDSIDLPFAGDKYAIQGAAAQVRAALMEDPSPHLALQAAALVQAKKYMATHGSGDQEVIVDVSADYDPDVWGDGGW
jgi:hypothetical protein